jgi:hypothetical protein
MLTNFWYDENTDIKINITEADCEVVNWTALA